MFISSLAQVPEQIQRYTPKWFLEDPVGQKVGLGLAVVGVLVVLFILFRTMKWAAARWMTFFWGAVVIAALYYGAVVLFNLGPMGWIAGAVIAFCMFVGFALFLTHSR